MSYEQPDFHWHNKVGRAFVLALGGARSLKVRFQGKH